MMNLISAIGLAGCYWSNFVKIHTGNKQLLDPKRGISGSQDLFQGFFQNFEGCYDTGNSSRWCTSSWILKLEDFS